MNHKLEELMKLDGLTEETVMYRYTLPEFLSPIEEEKYKLTANENATEIVEDLYGSGHLISAGNIGPGLTFLLNKESYFDLPQKKCVRIRLKDVLSQGGLIYPDSSSFVSGSYFLTLPHGSVIVKLVKD